MNLFEIENEIMNCWDQETGEILDSNRLDQLEMECDKKIENIALYIKNLTADAEALKAEKQSFEERQKAAENKADSLKRYLANYLAGQKFSTPRVAISFRKTQKVNVTDMTLIPEKYLKFADPTLDKISIKNAIKNGERVAGAELVDGKSMSIK